MSQHAWHQDVFVDLELSHDRSRKHTFQRKKIPSSAALNERQQARKSASDAYLQVLSVLHQQGNGWRSSKNLAGTNPGTTRVNRGTDIVSTTSHNVAMLPGCTVRSSSTWSRPGLSRAVAGFGPPRIADQKLIYKNVASAARASTRANRPRMECGGCQAS
jgi:hypothetical protein